MQGMPSQFILRFTKECLDDQVQAVHPDVLHGAGQETGGNWSQCLHSQSRYIQKLKVKPKFQPGTDIKLKVQLETDI